MRRWIAVMAVIACLAWAYADESNAFVQGSAAFKDGDWKAAMMLLRRATAEEKYDTDATRYMLVMAEINGSEAEAASADCDTFISRYPDSPYLSIVQYQKGRALFMMQDYDRCALCLSDFCHQYPDSPLYPSALFWIGECFFEAGSYDEAGALYTRVVDEYPADKKASEARYRLDTIAERLREAKLLYLLKKTGEEYLSTKEDYERQKQLGLIGAGGAVSTQDTEEIAASAQDDNDEAETGASGADSGASALDDKAGWTQIIKRLKEKAGEAETLMGAKK